MDKLTRAFSDFERGTQSNIPEIAGEIGITIGGRKRTEVPNRGQFVYVRLRSDLSELIEAFNDKVFPGYGLPVIVAWRNNRYEVIRRDAQRYPEWEAANPYLARHGSTHSLDKDGNNIGTDPVWVYPYQFIPSLVSPFNVGGVQNVYIHPYLMNYRDTWKYTGNTGTPSLAPYRPTSGSSIILISIDGETGNPALFSTTGTYIPSSVTGTVQLSGYLPNIDRGRYVPLSFIVMQSGTSSVSWSNIYDARQFYEVLPELQVNSLTDVTNIQFSGVNFYSTGTVAFIEAVGGGSSTGTAYPIVMEVDGRLETGTALGQPYLVTSSYNIRSVYLYCENLGVTGSTVIDVNKNGVSLFTGTAGITLPYNLTGSWVKLSPYYNTLVEGDIITIDIMQKANSSGNATIIISPSNSGSDGGGSITVKESDGSPSISNVSILSFDGFTVTNGGGGQAIIAKNSGYVLVREEQPAGTNGGTFTAGAWQTRTINTEVFDSDGICTLPGSNVIRLLAGTYEYRISAPASFVSGHKCRLYDVTAGAVVVGSSGTTEAANVDPTNTRSFDSGRFTISSSNDFRVEHRAKVTKATDGFGYPSNFGEVEVYTVAEFWRVA